jgi:hypothetical protein
MLLAIVLFAPGGLTKWLGALTRRREAPAA